MSCDEFDYYPFIKKCPVCGGEVHSHFEDEQYIEETQDEFIYLKIHCHKCNEEFNEDEFFKMEDFKD